MEAHELRPMPGNSCCQGQPPARKFVRYLKEDHVRKKGDKVLDRTKALYGPRTQAYGEIKYKNCNYYKFWTESRPCVVLGPKPMGKPSTKIVIITSSGQNQGLVWSSDPSLWGNQVQKF